MAETKEAKPSVDIQALNEKIAHLEEKLAKQQANGQNTTNTVDSIRKGIDERMLSEIKNSLEKAKVAFEKEKTIKRRIPKNYANKIGPTLPLGINGVRVVLPVDGSEFEIPKSFAAHLDEYLSNVTL